jgi:hypothetical protein
MIADEPLEVRNLGGRPCAEIDLETVRNSAKIGCTVNEIAAVLGVSRSTMFKYMALDPNIQIAIDEGRDMGCGTLRRFQWHKAEAGSDTMLIWLGKQMLGQKDKSEFTGADDGPLRVIVELVGDAAPQRVEQTAPQPGARLPETARKSIDFVG